VNHGLIFEALIHRLMGTKDVELKLHIRPEAGEEGNDAAAAVAYDLLASLYDSMKSGEVVAVRCFGDDDSKVRESFKHTAVDMTKSWYWNSGYPQFPTVDAVACLPQAKTVLYIHVITSEKDTNVHERTLQEFHGFVKETLSSQQHGDDNISSWKFRYVTVEPSLEDAQAFQRKRVHAMTYQLK
jgi:hypothetical protein